MTRAFAGFLSLLLAWLVSGAAWALPAAGASNNATIVVALLATLTGPGAVAGQDSVDGFNLAMRHLGGRFANQEVRVIVQDDKGSPDTAQTVVRRLLEREKIDFAVTALSQPSISAIVPLLAEAHTFIFNLEAVPAGMAGPACSPWFFQLATPEEAIDEALGANLATEKYHRAVVIGPQAPATGRASASLKRTWNGEIVEVLHPRQGAMRFTEEVAAIRQAAPDVVVDLLTGGMGGAFAREYANSGLKGEIPLIGVWQGWERPFLPAMTEAGMDVLNVAPWSPDLDTPLGKRMVADFELEHGRPTTGWVAQGYDTAQLLDSALRATNGKTGDRDALRNALRRADFPSVRGAFRFDTNHFPSVSVYLRRTARDAKGRANEELRAPLIRDWHSAEIAQCPMRWTEEAIHPAPGQAPAKPKPVAGGVPGSPPPKPR